MPPPSGQGAKPYMDTTYTAAQHSVGSRTPVRSPVLCLSAGDTGSYRPVKSDVYSVGIQVCGVYDSFI